MGAGPPRRGRIVHLRPLRQSRRARRGRRPAGLGSPGPRAWPARGHARIGRARAARRDGDPPAPGVLPALSAGRGGPRAHRGPGGHRRGPTAGAGNDPGHERGALELRLRLSEGSGGHTFNLYGERTLPERAQLPLRFEATSATAALLSRTQLRVRGWIEARVAQGRLEELRIPVPAGLEIVSVNGPIAGWDVVGGTLVVTPLEPVERTLAVEVEMTAEPRTSFVSPVLIPAGSRRTLPLVKAALQGDGLLTLADPGAVRGPEDTETARLPALVRGAGGRLLAVVDPARPPQWEAEWAGETEVLAGERQAPPPVRCVAAAEDRCGAGGEGAAVRSAALRVVPSVVPGPLRRLGFPLGHRSWDGLPSTPEGGAPGGRRNTGMEEGPKSSLQSSVMIRDN
jgi:hypothetical protein